LAPLWQNKKHMIQSSNYKIGWKCTTEFKTGTYCTQHHFVGDQNRVEKITQFFDSIEFSTQREFKTQTGLFKGKRISVISTGIGPTI
jgi:purine-nucleoside phosphorylase